MSDYIIDTKNGNFFIIYFFICFNFFCCCYQNLFFFFLFFCQLVFFAFFRSFFFVFKYVKYLRKSTCVCVYVCVCVAREKQNWIKIEFTIHIHSSTIKRKYHFLHAVLFWCVLKKMLEISNNFSFVLFGEIIFCFRFQLLVKFIPFQIQFLNKIRFALHQPNLSAISLDTHF